jgi:hypothetical protein
MRPDPPGAAPPSQFGPQPIGPGGESSAWKYIFIGCAVVAVIGIIALAGFCTYMGKRGNSLIASVLDMGKPEYMKMLTEGHTEEQREEFSRHYDLLGEKLTEKGLFKFSTEYGEVFEEFSRMAQDNKITVEESQGWIEKFDRMLEQE